MIDLNNQRMRLEYTDVRQIYFNLYSSRFAIINIRQQYGTVDLSMAL